MSLRPDQIKATLCTWIGKNRPMCEGDVLIDELCFVDRKRRADLVHANGKLSAFEIKSEADSLARWPGQEEAYHKVFDEIWMCCHYKHLSRALSNSLNGTGIIVFDDFSNMAVAKPAKENKKTDGFMLTSFLWKENLQDICSKHNMQFKKSDTVTMLRQAVVNNLPKDVVKSYVVDILKKRYG